MGFQPTQEMIQVRRSARKLYDEGLRLVGEWCKKIPHLTPGTWRKWEGQGGFLDWWSELIGLRQKQMAVGYPKLPKRESTPRNIARPSKVYCKT